MQPSAIKVVVSDSGPLIALGRLDRLAILSDVFSEVQVCEATPIRVDGLGAGESAAIGRAMEIGAALMADDLAARHHAAGLGLTVIGTLGVPCVRSGCACYRPCCR